MNETADLFGLQAITECGPRLSAISPDSNISKDNPVTFASNGVYGIGT